MEQDLQDRLRRQDIIVSEIRHELPYFQLTAKILKCCFEVMEELGSGFSGSGDQLS